MIPLVNRIGLKYKNKGEDAGTAHGTGGVRRIQMQTHLLRVNQAIYLDSFFGKK